jgi:preprotein translocase SecE subunit
MKDVKEKAKNNVVTNYVRESMQELTKVTWPTKNQAVRLTAIVLGFCVVFAAFLAAVDYVASTGYTEVLKFAAQNAAPSVEETISPEAMPFEIDVSGAETETGETIELTPEFTTEDASDTAE